MVDQYYFNFSNFKSTMDVPEVDEVAYGLILRAVMSYAKRVYAIDFLSTTSPIISLASTSSFTMPVDATIIPGLAIESADEVSEITSIVVDIDGLTQVVTYTPAFSTIPTAPKIYLTAVPFDLQYAVYLHAKYLAESQKKNTYIIDSVTDTSGNKATYKAKPPALVHSIYAEYSPNPMAFI